MSSDRKYSLIVPNLQVGGAERQALSMIDRMNGMRPGIANVICLESVGECSSGVEVLSVGGVVSKSGNRVFRVLSKIYMMIKLAVFLKEADRDLIIYNPYIIRFIPLLKVFYSGGVHVSVREMNKKYLSWYVCAVLKKCSSITTNTESVYYFLRRKGLSVNLFRNYIEPVEPSFYGRDFRRIMVVSNIARHKRIEDIIKAFDGKDVEINVFGEVVDNVYESELQALLHSESKLRVVFHGKVCRETLSGYYRKCGVLVHASIIEGTSNAILDAMNYGIPLLVSNIEENSSLVDGLECFTFRAMDSRDLSSKYDALMSKDVSSCLRDLNSKVGDLFGKDNLTSQARFYEAGYDS